jgi:hypothetical protein
LASIDGKSIRSTSIGGPTAAQNFITVVSMHERQPGVLHLRLMENPKASENHVAQALMAEVLSQLPAGYCIRPARIMWLKL